MIFQRFLQKPFFFGNLLNYGRLEKQYICISLFDVNCCFTHFQSKWLIILKSLELEKVSMKMWLFGSKTLIFDSIFWSEICSSWPLPV